MFKAASEYYQLPLYNSQHHYFTDLVPFLPIVLKGYLDYYSPYLNFNALGKEQILNLIDFGINPSYILTAEPTTKLLYTKARNYYSTEYADFREQIIENYQYINNALSQVHGARIIAREVLDAGIVGSVMKTEKLFILTIVPLIINLVKSIFKQRIIWSYENKN